MSSLYPIGGAGPYFTNMTAVEFFDLNTGKWINLPNLERGRYVHAVQKENKNTWSTRAATLCGLYLNKVFIHMVFPTYMEMFLHYESP